MLNRIIIINSELYAKASIHIGDNNSIQMTAENNVGKSSFCNTLNFLYLPDRDQMRFEDNRSLADSMKHYFSGTSLQSFIIFEIVRNGYYCILVKATPDNTIEYYKINGEFKENFFIQKSAKGFTPKKWDNALKELTLNNSTDPPVLLKNEELFNLIYNSDKNKSPVVWIKKEVKRKGRAFSNSFTEIYKHLIKTSEINEKSFKNALLIADNRQDLVLNVFTGSSFEKINEFDKKKTHLDNLKAVEKEFAELKLLFDKFVGEEAFLGKLKNTFIKKFGEVEKDLAAKTHKDSLLSIEIRNLERKFDITLKNERDNLIREKTGYERDVQQTEKNISAIDLLLKEIEGYEPTDDDLLFRGLNDKKIDDERKLRELESHITQSERNDLTQDEIERAISKAENEITVQENEIEEFTNLLYQNISKNPEIVRKAYSYLNSKVAKLHKSKFKGKIQETEIPLTFFGSVIDVSSIEVETLPTIQELKEDLKVKKKDLSERKIQLNAVKNKPKLVDQITELKTTVSNTQKLIDKINDKPNQIASKIENEKLLRQFKESVRLTQEKIHNKDEEITITKNAWIQKGNEKRMYQDDLTKVRGWYKEISDKQDVYEIEEILDIPFEKIFEKFDVTYKAFTASKQGCGTLKDSINKKLSKDIQGIKQFIGEVQEEIINIPLLDKGINSLLDTLSYEIGNPTSSFLDNFNGFKTFIYKNYNTRLAQYAKAGAY